MRSASQSHHLDAPSPLQTSRAVCEPCGRAGGPRVRRPKVLCHLTAPHVVVWSAVMASSSFPGLFPSRELLTRNHAGDFVFIDQLGDSGTAPLRRWRDGSLESDLPLQVLARTRSHPLSTSQTHNSCTPEAYRPSFSIHQIRYRL
jgi:predicted acylesterase/phospholipase RssA